MVTTPQTPTDTTATATGTTRTAAVSPDTVTDDQFRDWMRGHLHRAAATLGVSVTGSPVFGWCLRSISAPAHDTEGQRCWLRVGTERDRDLADPTMAAFWTGLADANAVTGVAKPVVLHSTDWAEPAWARRVRADVMTFLPGHPASLSDVLHKPLDLPDSWWADMRASLDTVTLTPTTRFIDHSQAGTRIATVFGNTVAAAWRPRTWHTCHGDLHWNNLLAPEFGLLDWEFWGSGPVGHDAATLYLFSLLAPDTAQRVHEVFADLLDSPHGLRAQVGVASRILYRAQRGAYPELADAVRRHIHPIINTAAQG